MKLKNAKEGTVVFIKARAVGEFYNSTLARHIGIIEAVLTVRDDPFSVQVRCPHSRDGGLAPEGDWFRPEDLKRLKPPAQWDEIPAGTIQVVLEDYEELRAGDIVTVTYGATIIDPQGSHTVTDQGDENHRAPSYLTATHPEDGM